ncbi:hypothetical protein AAFG07_34280 [Bradyrhizobium sp. B097]|uniref:hypothetical protein n=1 Tax=Bradyrhizobium sp. B097 TaxID=3140244 RepID=UPI0031833247
MYNQINGSSWFQSSCFAEADEQTDADRFADGFANMNLAAPGSSGSSPLVTGPYSLVPRPPVIEINRSSFIAAARTYCGAEIKLIADMRDTSAINEEKEVSGF